MQSGDRSVLFKKELAPVVGGGDIGELFVEVNPDAIKQLSQKVRNAEEKDNTNPLTGNKRQNEPKAEEGRLSKIGKEEGRKRLRKR